MPFTVALSSEHRSTLKGALGRSARGLLEWEDRGPADVVIGLPGQGRLAHCDVWPGKEGALALVVAGFERWRDEQAMGRLHEIGRALASEQNLDRLLDMILTQGRELLESDAGSIYLVAENGQGVKELVFAHTQNAKVDLPFRQFRMPISTSSMSGYVAVTGESLNIADAYEIPADAPYHFSDSWDKQAGYRTTSMLVVPMKDADGQVLGVLQFINRLEDEVAVPFLATHQKLAESLAGQAGVAVKNARLREEIEQLFEGFVNASVTAIESRDPVTSGHSGRVADLTVGLAEAVNRTTNGPYGPLHFSDRQLREIRYASLLHDFGKVGVREQVLVKAKKLDHNTLELVLQRLRQRELERALDLLSQAWRGGQHFDPAHWDKVLQDEKAETERLIQLVSRSNEPTVLSQEVAEGLGLLGELDVSHWSGDRVPVVEQRHLTSLNIRRGSLSPEERLEIESHVTHTFRFLRLIPWTKDLAGVPEIAYAHHERLSGTGYPRQLKETEIPPQSKAMAIADVFDALTARDRPYKTAVPLEKSLAILGEEALGGGIDPLLLNIFIEAKVFERTVKPL